MHIWVYTPGCKFIDKSSTHVSSVMLKIQHDTGYKLAIYVPPLIITESIRISHLLVECTPLYSRWHAQVGCKPQQPQCILCLIPVQ